MLEYAKIILAKISFDKRLFRKEFRKAYRNLSPEERERLSRWIRSEWGITRQ